MFDIINIITAMGSILDTFTLKPFRFLYRKLRSKQIMFLDDTNDYQTYKFSGRKNKTPYYICMHCYDEDYYIRRLVDNYNPLSGYVAGLICRRCNHTYHKK
jgi:hypothetical protein